MNKNVGIVFAHCFALCEYSIFVSNYYKYYNYAVVDACFLYTHKIRVFILCCSNFYDSTEFCCLFLSIMESGILEIFCNGTDSSFCLFVLSVLVEAAYY